MIYNAIKNFGIIFAKSFAFVTIALPGWHPETGFSVSIVSLITDTVRLCMIDPESNFEKTERKV